MQNKMIFAVKMMGVKKTTRLLETEPFQMPKEDEKFSYKDYLFGEKFHAVCISPKSGMY